MEADQNKAWGFSLFCDDIRMEVGGKLTAVGIYGADYIVHGDFPMIVPKFTILIMYFQMLHESLGNVKITIQAPAEKDTDTIAEIDISDEDIKRVSANIGETPELPIFNARIPITFSPLLFQREGKIQVRAHYPDGSHLKLGALLVRAARQGEAPSPSL